MNASLLLREAALIVAHPGHELRVRGWMERAAPRLFVLTDGSGSDGRPRIESTLNVARACNSKPGAVFGRFKDRDFYRMILDCDVDPCVRIVNEIAESLVAARIEIVVADSWQMYNPVHDVCSILAGLAASAAGIEEIEYPVVDTPVEREPRATFTLTDEALERKIRAAREYTQLKDDIDTVLARGVESLRIESFYAPGSCRPLRDAKSGRPFYEVHGEERVAEHRYDTVLTLNDHVLPFVEKLARATQPLRATTVA